MAEDELEEDADMEVDDDYVEEEEEAEEDIEIDEGAGDLDKADAEEGSSGTAGSDINVNSFEELRLDESVIAAAQENWKLFISAASSREAAGEAIYAALFDSAPSLQSLFTTPRAIQAMKFMNGLNQFIMGLSDPAALKVAVETLGFGHLALDVTIPRVVIFRDAILDLLQVELGSRFSSEAYAGWKAMLNYVGGAIIFIKAFYADRIRLLGESWRIANNAASNKDKFATMDRQVSNGAEDDKMDRQVSGRSEARMGSKERTRSKGGERSGSKKLGETDNEEKKSQQSDSLMQNVPTTFKDMFQFNAAVMGFGQAAWMNEVLACFDNIVSNVSNSQRLVEECDVLVCRIARVVTGKVNLAEFKSCMLASLRSLLPKDWTTAHEVAWSWLWENVERTLMKNMGMPPIWERAYAKLLDSIDEATGFQLRKDIYLKFFALAPAGQDFFKQSNTYLHLIATKVLIMVIDMYREPVRMVDDISALGLRHVGYAIPTEYMPPFASACVEVVQGLTKDQNCIDGFQWSIGLVAKSLVRTILEGSTIVMKAINVNSKRSMVKAISVAPRGERSSWMLLIQVGTQNISPLAWAIESGSLQSASIMIKDLLTFRADRDRYYYACDEIFSRHNNIVQMLLNDAPSLLPDLLDGLVWRSRVTVEGLRRANYYVKHLLVDPDGKCHQTLEWVGKARDPKLVTHPVLVFVSDKLWKGAATKAFLYRKSWFLCTLMMFVISQSIIEHWHEGEKTPTERYTMFGFRCFIYLLSMGQMIFHHTKYFVRAFKNIEKNTFRLFGFIRVPLYLDSFQESCNFSLMLCLMVMVSSEPILHCMQHNHGVLFTDICTASKSVKFFPYSVFSMCGMGLYYFLLIDLAVFNNRISAYLLVASRMVAELGLFLMALSAFMLAFSCAFSCLDQKEKEFHGIQSGTLSLLEMALDIYSDDGYDRLHNSPMILLGSFLFLVIISVFLVDVFVAQLTSAYSAVYHDMVGYARLKRIRIIVESIPSVGPARWVRFVESMKLNQPIEFNDGDVGVPSGLATVEPANLHPTTYDMIKRFGGSTNPSIAWPEDDDNPDDADKFERLEAIIKRTMDRIAQSLGGRKQHKHGKESSSGGDRGSGHQGESGDLPSFVESDE